MPENQDGTVGGARARSTAAGDVYGRLTVLERSGRTLNFNALWRCLCECGAERIVRQDKMRRGETVSCGCRSVTHGLSNDPAYSCWRSAKDRTTNPNSAAWRYYGGRGITMAPEFLASFEAFLAEAGPRPGPEYSIDRRDNGRGYEPGNLKWSTQTEQMRNSRQAKLTVEDAVAIRLAAATRSQRSLAKDYGVTSGTIWALVHGKTWR